MKFSRVAFAFSTCVVALAISAALVLQPAYAADTPALSEAQAAEVIDAQGHILWSKNPDEQRGLASITKVMTAMVALDSGVDLDTPHTLAGFDTGENSQAVGYVAGDTATLRQLLQVMLVFSANDAAEEIAHIISGSDDAFCKLMNQKAQQLGMTNTHFANPHGLKTDGHYSSVADLVEMGRYALENYPFIAKTVKMPSVEVTASGSTFWVESTDELMGTYQGMLGIKTGSIEGETTFLGASERGDIRLYTAVLGCSTSAGRFADTAALMDWVYSNFANKSLATEKTIISWQPFADLFGWYCPVYIQSDVSGLVQSNSDSVTWTCTRANAQTMAYPGDSFGGTLWQQGSRSLGGSVLVCGKPIANLPNFGVFTTLLFVNPALVAWAVS